jgi:uncharacterized protein (DUF433 family)
MITEQTATIPLVQDANGTIHVEGSRITLDTIIGQYKQGATPEQIQEDFPTLSLRDIYSVITYYLTYPNEVENYLKERKKEAAQIRAKIEAEFSTQNFRELIRNRARERNGKNSSL